MTSVTKSWVRDLEAARYPNLARLRSQCGEPGAGEAWSLTFAVLDRTASLSSSVAWGNTVLGEADTMADVEAWATGVLAGRDPVTAALDLAKRLASRVQANCHRRGLRQQAGLADAAWVLEGIVDYLAVEARSRQLRPVAPSEGGGAVAGGRPPLAAAGDFVDRGARR